MKIPYKLSFEGRDYDFLSDDSREVKKDHRVLFVETPCNTIFAKELSKSGYKILHYSNLRNYFKCVPKIIGITGTNGKTTTANIIYHILNDLGYKCAMLGTQGLFFAGKQLRQKGLTTPVILELYADLDLLYQQGCEIIVMEVSSHAISQQRIFGLRFDVKILTNIASDHLDYHKDLDSYIAIKNSFLQDSGIKIINIDDKNVHYNHRGSLSYGIQENADLFVRDFMIQDKMIAKIIYQNQEYILKSCLYGLHNLYNLLGAILCIKVLYNVEMQIILQSIQSFCGVSGRMEVVLQKPLVIVDFAHTYDGMQKIMEGFVNQKVKVVFGAGGDRDRTKRPLMGHVAQKYATKIYLTSDNPRSEDPDAIIQDILEGITTRDEQKIIIEADRYKAIFRALEEIQEDEVLLVLGKGDENYQILKDGVIPFDDRKVIKNIYQQLKNRS